MCLGVICHLHFWHNDRGLLRAAAVTRGLQRTPHKSQHTKLTLEKKILPPLLPRFELATFRSRVRRSNQQAIPVSTVKETQQRQNHRQYFSLPYEIIPNCSFSEIMSNLTSSENQFYHLLPPFHFALIRLSLILLLCTIHPLTASFSVLFHFLLPPPPPADVIFDTSVELRKKISDLHFKFKVFCY